jgi:transcriptional regulator with XRE-family HTH domain
MELLKKEAELQGGNQPAAIKIGIDRTSFAHYLDGSREPTTRTLTQIANYFHTNIAWLRGDSPDARIPAPKDLSPEKTLLWNAIQNDMTDDEALEMVVNYRKKKKGQLKE